MYSVLNIFYAILYLKIILQNIINVYNRYNKKGINVESPLEFTIDEKDAGLRIDLVISEKYPDLSRSKIQKAIENGIILLNDKTFKKRNVPKAGDTVSIGEDLFKQSQNYSLEAQNIPLNIIWEDEYFAVVNKQAGLVVHPGSGNRDMTLVNALLYHLKDLSAGSSAERPGIVHRLDKNTSGIMIVAKTDRAHQLMSDLFSKREVHKEYIGICVGRRPDNDGSMDGPIGRSKNDPIRFCITPTGRTALTDYKLLGFKDGMSFINFRLHTGRTHQIRIHCSQAGFPIIEDDLYGGQRKRVQNMQPLERIFAYKIFKCFERQALHSYRLKFTHPFTKNEVDLYASLPSDFQRAVKLFESEGVKINIKSS